MIKREDVVKRYYDRKRLKQFSVFEKVTDDFTAEFMFEKMELPNAWRVVAVLPMAEAVPPVVCSTVFSTYIGDQPVEDVAALGMQALMPSIIQAQADLTALMQSMSRAMSGMV